MIRPPTSAPGMLPKPPTTAAGKAFRPMKPMLACTKVIGASSRPAMAADGGGQAPDQAVQRAHRDAHVVGRQLVLRGRLHGDADLAVAEQREQQPRTAPA
jgi:hypothetical protein